MKDKKYKILTVEDREEDLYMMEVILKGGGYDVDTASNGLEAFEKLSENTFDLIISDILMPKMDGFQLCKEVKSNDTLKNIPFIFVTASYINENDETFGSDLGADKFILKPIEPEEFLREVKYLLEEAEENRLPSHMSPTPQKEDSQKETSFIKEHAKSLIEKVEEMEKEDMFLKEHSARLVTQLEGKMIELEETNKKLEEEIEERKKKEDDLRSTYERLQKAYDELANVYKNI